LIRCRKSSKEPIISIWKLTIYQTEKLDSLKRKDNTKNTNGDKPQARIILRRTEKPTY